MAFGTLSVADLLAAGSTVSVVDFGLDRAFAAIDNSLAAHNRIMNELTADLVDRTTDRLRRYGGLDQMTMEQLDEYGTPRVQKVGAGATVGFPLKLFGIAYQWTRKWFQNHTPAELAAQATAAMEADTRVIVRDIKRAIFTATNSTFDDHLVDSVDLPVKALLNADSAPIPVGPNGETFTAASHTHYLGTGSFAAADLTSLIEHVAEHYGTGEIVVYINRAQETAIRGFTGFYEYLDARLVGATDATRVVGRSLNMTQYYNRAIGLFAGAEIIVKPWVPASYLFAFNRAAPKPLAMRTRPGAGGFEVSYDGEVHPLTARGFEREFGVSVWTRPNGAVLYTGNATYASPTIT
jgi:hypothetical protein